MHRFGSNWKKAFATSLMVAVALAAGPTAASVAASNNSSATSSDVHRLIDDATYTGMYSVSSSDQKKLFNDATFSGTSDAASTDQRKLLNDANYRPLGHPPIGVSARPAASVPVLVMHGASWLAVWALATALAVSLALLTTREWRRRRPPLGV